VKDLVEHDSLLLFLFLAASGGGFCDCFSICVVDLLTTAVVNSIVVT
jgi:hypothetical protein